MAHCVARGLQSIVDSLRKLCTHAVCTLRTFKAEHVMNRLLQREASAFVLSSIREARALVAHGNCHEVDIALVSYRYDISGGSVIQGSRPTWKACTSFERSARPNYAIV